MTERLLEKITYVSREPTRVTDLNGLALNVRDTFPMNPESKTAMETARRWASNYGRNKEEPVIVTVDNEPMDLFILDLERRSEGGRAYKVHDLQHRRFDLREDQLLEAIAQAGIAAGGRINGQFQWGISGSQVRLAFVGGEQWSRMKRSADIHASDERHVVPSALVPGSVYLKKDRESLCAFVGAVSSSDLDGTHYAYVEVPRLCVCQPSDELVARFDALTIEQRLQGHHDGDLRVWNAMSIVLVKTPKLFRVNNNQTFDNTRYRDNVDGSYRYVSPGGDDLAEKVRVQALGERPRFHHKWEYGLYHTNRELYDKINNDFNNKRADEVKQTRLEFRDRLKWK